MGHYDGCYAADEAKSESKNVTTDQKFKMLKRLQRKSVSFYTEECDNNRIIIKAIEDDPKLSELIKFNSGGYKIRRVSLAVDSDRLAKTLLEY